VQPSTPPPRSPLPQPPVFMGNQHRANPGTAYTIPHHHSHSSHSPAQPKNPDAPRVTHTASSFRCTNAVAHSRPARTLLPHLSAINTLHRRHSAEAATPVKIAVIPTEASRHLAMRSGGTCMCSRPRHPYTRKLPLHQRQGHNSQFVILIILSFPSAAKNLLLPLSLRLLLPLTIICFLPCSYP
jgi:hypothetical protein